MLSDAADSSFRPGWSGTLHIPRPFLREAVEDLVVARPLEYGPRLLEAAEAVDVESLLAATWRAAFSHADPGLARFILDRFATSGQTPREMRALMQLRKSFEGVPEKAALIAHLNGGLEELTRQGVYSAEQQEAARQWIDGARAKDLTMTALRAAQQLWAGVAMPQFQPDRPIFPPNRLGLAMAEPDPAPVPRWGWPETRSERLALVASALPFLLTFLIPWDLRPTTFGGLLINRGLILLMDVCVVAPLLIIWGQAQVRTAESMSRRFDGRLWPPDRKAHNWDTLTSIAPAALWLGLDPLRKAFIQSCLPGPEAFSYWHQAVFLGMNAVGIGLFCYGLQMFDSGRAYTAGRIA
jgi:hypothetical protein